MSLENHRPDNREKLWLTKGQGSETQVHVQLVEDKDGEMRERGIVFKSYQGDRYIDLNDLPPEQWPGFDAKTKQALQRQYEQLSSRYGEYIPKQQIVRHPLHSKKWIVAQENIHLREDGKPILQYTVNDPPPEEVRDQLKDLTERLRVNLKARQDLTEPFCLLDLVRDTDLVISSDNRILCTDTGSLGGDFQNEPMTMKEIAQVYGCQIARLELLAGKTPKDILAQPEYHVLAELVDHTYRKNIGRRLTGSLDISTMRPAQLDAILRELHQPYNPDYANL